MLDQLLYHFREARCWVCSRFLKDHITEEGKWIPCLVLDPLTKDLL